MFFAFPLTSNSPANNMLLSSSREMRGSLISLLWLLVVISVAFGSLPISATFGFSISDHL
ncbi:hypothetical protein HanOQP8_Chr01g0019831 [Helianthus annuus]|nr:hypothetical protein HanOQP8_Chr01g0019831 [Helianthus annuus]